MDRDLVSLSVLKEAQEDLDPENGEAIDRLAEALCTLLDGFLTTAIEEMEEEKNDRTSR